MELDGAVLALAVSVAGVTVAREAHGHCALAGEGNQTQAVGNELVVEDRGVHLDLNQIDGDCGDFGDHDAAECVGDTGVSVAQLELHEVVPYCPDFDLREPLFP
ncbi:HIT zinc finger [Striga asiatica]|uniref:HIT zinc finger n=1 Tax=Striga asiatica TaxID=4170 RepID=A0A5A7P885_STRAF|nr:HIT zinc finger [Striga asiatica]